MNSQTFKKEVMPLAYLIYPMVARILNGQENAEDAVQEIAALDPNLIESIDVIKGEKVIKDYKAHKA